MNFIFYFFYFFIFYFFSETQFSIYFPIIQDVFIYDTGKELFTWIGKGTSSNEKKRAMEFAHVSITVLYSF